MKNLLKDVTDIHAYTPEHGKWMIGFNWNGFRHHFWFKQGDVQIVPIDDTLYRNPLAGIEHGEPGDFRTRRLSIAKNAALIRAVINHAIDSDAIEEGKARARMHAEAEERRQWREAEERVFESLSRLADRFGADAMLEKVTNLLRRRDAA